jgi:hypothetical protein
MQNLALPVSDACSRILPVIISLSAFRAKDRLLKSWPERQSCKSISRDLDATVSVARPAPTAAEVVMDSNQIARGRIRQFESDMPSQAVRSSEVGRSLK